MLALNVEDLCRIYPSDADLEVLVDELRGQGCWWVELEGDRLSFVGGDGVRLTLRGASPIEFIIDMRCKLESRRATAPPRG